MYYAHEKGLIALTAALLIFAISGVAQQQSEQPGTEVSKQEADTTQPMDAAEAQETPAFSKLDINQDGVLTKAEASSTWLADNFKLYDLNLDGYINESEYELAEQAQS
jgi:Ca2+-binding EF-hand superfamily protein